MQDFIYFWFRRDLRLNDNHGLFRALTSGLKVRGIFIFDTQILDALHKPHDARVEFIHHEIKELATETNGGFDVFYGNSIEIWENLLKNASNTGLKGVYCNRDYEPTAIKRDEQIKQLCFTHQVDFQQFKDQVIFEQAEVVKDDGKPYTVFTPYMKKWKTRLDQVGIELYPSENHKEAFLSDERFSLSPRKIPTLEEMGFAPTGIDIPQKTIDQGRIRKYEQTRDFPSIVGTSRLSVHFRFGTISIREKFKNGYSLSEKWINELIWREFYMQILWHFPQVVTESFKPQYDRIQWENNDEHFELWKQGKTGYPLVDAGMRELNATGFMHNRVRMVVASFLTKHLLIDWRWEKRTSRKNYWILNCPATTVVGNGRLEVESMRHLIFEFLIQQLKWKSLILNCYTLKSGYQSMELFVIPNLLLIMHLLDCVAWSDTNLRWGKQNLYRIY